MKITQTVKRVFIATIAAFSVLVIGGSVAAPVFATPATDACEGLKLADPDADCTDSKGAQTSVSENIVKPVINILSIVVGIVAVIMIIIGGFLYIISNGDATKTKQAKDTILYAIVGLVVVLFAQIIVRFVITKSTETTTNNSKATGKP